jgi:prophage antirepressor-like protein
MSSNEQYPARVEQFHAVAVTIYEIDGKDYLAGEDIGRCLGLENPRKMVNQIYNRNRDELDAHSSILKMKTNYPGNPQNRLFTETGANLIGMFSRTAKSKDFRLWLARLPRRVRELVNGQAVRQAFELGLEQGMALLTDLAGDLISLEDLGQLITLRRLGFTQREAGASLGISREQVQYLEKRLKDKGIEFAALNQHQRRKKFRAAVLAEFKGVRQIPPSPPLLKGGDKGPQAGAPALP